MNNPYATPQSQPYEQPAQHGPPLITQRSYNALMKRKPWLYLFGALQFLSALFAAVILGFVAFAGSPAGDMEVDLAGEAAKSGGGETIWVFVFLLPMVLIPFFFGLFLIRAGKAIGRLRSTQAEMDLLTNVTNEHKYWRLLGGVTIFYLVIIAAMVGWIVWAVSQISPVANP